MNATFEKKTPGTEPPESSVRRGALQAPILAGRCLPGSFLGAKQGTGQPSHHPNYIFCVSPASRAPVEPPGAAEDSLWRDGNMLPNENP